MLSNTSRSKSRRSKRCNSSHQKHSTVSTKRQAPKRAIDNKYHELKELRQQGLLFSKKHQMVRNGSHTQIKNRLTSQGSEPFIKEFKRTSSRRKNFKSMAVKNYVSVYQPPRTKSSMSKKSREPSKKRVGRDSSSNHKGKANQTTPLRNR